MEVARVETPRSVSVNKLESPLIQAKTSVGRAVSAAIGPRSLKEFGDAGQMSNVTSGRLIPDYLARIYLDDEARRRFAMALLSGDPAVRTRTVIEIDDRPQLPVKADRMARKVLPADEETEE